jgi:hypothetical protein
VDSLKRRQGGESRDMSESHRRELARFLRARREAISPAEAGLSSYGRRRTPGLRREEVALLANIGVAWYSKLEMAHEMRASSGTLFAIAEALRLDRPQTEYVFTLAGVPMPRTAQTPSEGLPEALNVLVPNIEKVGAFVWDRYLTIVRWNAIADAMFDISRHSDPFERNSLIRLIRDTERSPYYTSDYEQLVQSLVGMFRRAYVTETPTPLAERVFEAARGFPIFQRFWDQQLVAEELFGRNTGPFKRHHAKLGEYFVVTTNLQVFHRDDLMIRIVAPADEAAVKKFKLLAKMGTGSTLDTVVDA